MQKEIAKTALQEQPEFSTLLSFLREQVNRSADIVGQTRVYGNNLKPLHSNREQQPISPESPGVVGLLWVELYKLRDINDEASVNMDHFRNIIGS